MDIHQSHQELQKMSPAINIPLSKIASGLPGGPLVTVCGAVSSFDHVISSPTETNVLNGI